MDDLVSLHYRILSCRLCVEAGYLSHAAPVVVEPVPRRIMLVGQAPGQVEDAVRRPFAGRSGRVLFGWLASVGISEEEFRRHVYMTAVTKCFPGKARGGAGDRRPSAREIALCRPFLDHQLALIRPEVLLLVGGLAIDRYLPRIPLTDVIGQTFEVDGTHLIPLPHPSGASRWLNVPAHRDLLRQALGHVLEAWNVLVPAST